MNSHILLNAEIDNRLKMFRLVDNFHDILKSDSNDNLEFYINNPDNVKESVMNIIRWVDSVQTHYMQSTDIMRSRVVCLIKAECKVSEKQITNLTDNIMYKLLDFIGMHTAGVGVLDVDKVIGVDDYAKILSQCEREEVSATIMKELLNHRICIPETNILHPLVLKLLSKYDMPTLCHDMPNPTPQEMIQYYKRCDDQDKDASDAAINVVCKVMLEYYENHPDLLDTPGAIALLGELVPIV